MSNGRNVKPLKEGPVIGKVTIMREGDGKLRVPRFLIQPEGEFPAFIRPL
jgi:hypothetical protein